MDINFHTPENIEVLVSTMYSNNIPLDIYSHNFDWSGSTFPPIKAIIVRQGKTAAEITEYRQYNMLIEATQQLMSMGHYGSSGLTPRKILVMGETNNKVDLFLFEVYNNVITNFFRKTTAFGEEIDGSASTGWKPGYNFTESGIMYAN